VPAWLTIYLSIGIQKGEGIRASFENRTVKLRNIFLGDF
jgi:hypothetical protein